MQNITFKDLYELYKKERHYNLLDFASDTKLSISILSKLKTGATKITNKTRKIFKEIYGVNLIEINKTQILNDELSLAKDKIEALKSNVKIVEDANLCYYNKNIVLSKIISLPYDFFSEKKTSKLLYVLEKMEEERTIYNK